MTIAEAEYAVATFVDDVRAIVAETDDDKKIIQRVIPLAKRIATSPGWIREAFYDCDSDQGFGITVLHEEADHTLLIEAIAWLPGRGVAPHDHQTWGVVVGLDGDEVNVNWLRQDDGAKTGYAELAVHNEVSVGPGEVIAFLPDDIHSVRNDGEKTSLSLHIYGKTLAYIDRSEFDPDAKIQRPCPKRVRNRA